MQILFKNVLAGLIVLLILLTAEIIITAILVGSQPTDIFVSPFKHFNFYKTLWASSPWETIKLLLLNKAVLIVEHKDTTSGSQVWGLHFYALNLLLHCMVALLASMGWISRWPNKTGKAPVLFALGSFLLIFANSYVYLASCCSAGPGWIIDIWLLSHALDPIASPHWLEIYQSVERLFIFAQIFLSIGGAALIFRSWTLPRH